MAVASQAPPAEEPAAGGDAPVPTMANTKAEIVTAAHAAGLLDETDDGSAWTKQEILDLWEG